LTKSTLFCRNKKHQKTILLLLVFSFAATFLACNFNAAHNLAGTPVASSGSLSPGDVSMLGGAFAPLVGIGSSPFIALTVLSGVGSLLNSGTINPDNIPFASALMQLPISYTGVFVTLLVITLAKFLLSMLSVSKVLCDATLGKLENMVGILCAAGGTFLVASATTVYASEIATSNLGSAGVGAIVLTYVISFAMAALAYAVYIVMKTMVAAIDVLAFLFSPIPGTTGLFTVIKHVVISLYTWVAVVNPIVSAVIGVICVVIACLVFRAAKRLELYYRRIYLIPFANAIFRKGLAVPLIPKKLPRGVAAEFDGVDICIECFFMNRTSGLYKRERCHFVRSGKSNYVFKKRLFGKTVKIELLGDVYIEKPAVFRFVRIFTDEALHSSRRKVSLVVRREHGRDTAELIAKAGLIDYNLVLEERRRKKAEEMALKMQQMKQQAAEKIASAGKKLQGTFGGIFSRE